MEKLKKQLEDIKGALPLMIKLGAIDQSAYKTLNEALTEALQQYAVMQRSEQLFAFLEYCDNAGWIKNVDKKRIIEDYEKANNCV
jgi:hypothetical protein